MTRFGIVSPEWPTQYRSDVTVIDVRERHDFIEIGHIPGARNIPYDSFRDSGSGSAGKLPIRADFEELLGEAGIGPDDDILAYDGENGVYAARFLLTADVFGHGGRLRLLDGGFESWRTVAETETGTVEHEPTDYRANSPEETRTPIVEREDVEAAVEDDTILLDTRTPTEYNQAHIPSAVQLGWESLLSDGRLRPEAEIKQLLEEREITRDRRIILYCNTARRLSHTYVVLKHLGFERVEFYEKSLTDWIRQESPTWDPEGTAAIIREYAESGGDVVRAELGDDVSGRLKLVGIYGTKHDGYYMLRTKIPGGQLTGEQAHTIADVAHEFARAPEAYGGNQQNPIFGDVYLDVTTRQDIQMHWIELEDIPEIWDRYEAVGLTTMQACGNSVRNVVCCPADGLGAAPMETGDLADEITDRFLLDEYYANMPRKFKVSVTGCHENCARAQINDIGFLPARKDGRLGFHVLVGGGLSDGPRAASDLDVFIERKQVIPLVEAVADVFMRQGNYLDIAANRLRFLVEAMGITQFREEVQRRFPFEFESAGEELTTSYRGDHVGVHEQTDGNRYVGLNVPTGRLLAGEFRTLVSLSEEYGDGEVRLTLNQNVLLPHIPPESVDELLAEPLLETYRPNPGPFERGIVTCTGSEFCTYGIIETKTRGLRWARELDAQIAASDEIDESDLPEAIRIHMSGCSASCAQPQIGDFGLRGERYRDDTEEVPAADVGLGGDLERGEFIDWIAGSLPIDDVPDAIRRSVRCYARERNADESFGDWTRRQSFDRLRALLYGETVRPKQQTEVS